MMQPSDLIWCSEPGHLLFVFPLQCSLLPELFSRLATGSVISQFATLIDHLIVFFSFPLSTQGQQSILSC